MASSPGYALNDEEVRRISQFQLNELIKIATWNIRMLFAAAKLHNLAQKMNRMKIDMK